MVKTESKSKTDSALLIKHYLWLNQAAYAIVAFPIGTVLSIAPLFLNIERGMDIQTIGFMMMGGEFLGICAMKLAEISESGFIFPRPYDLHFINAAIALSLIAIPLWPYPVMSGICMMLVQTFNSSSKPVVGESMHRLAVFTEREPSKVFAQANTWRRIGNGTIGAATPLMFAVSSDISFYLVGVIILVFLGLCVHVDFKIKTKFNDATSSRKTSRKSTIAMMISMMKSNRREGSNLAAINENTSESGHCANSDNECNRRGTTSCIEEEKEDEDYDEEKDDAKNDIKNEEPSKNWGTLYEVEKEDEDHDEEKDDAQNDIKSEEPSKNWGPLYAYFLIVYAFPFWDASISRLPFAFLTIAIANEFSIVVAAAVLFGYQMGRAISQFIQVWRCDTVVNYVLNGITLAAYIAFVTYINVSPDGQLWFVPFIFAGLAETLPIQQLYLLGLFGDAEEDNMSLRHAVKASHTGTGIGSMAAFIAATQVYSRYGINGVAYLGLGIMLGKLATNLQIDYLHYHNKKR